jgi:hypothetical protein
MKGVSARPDDLSDQYVEGLSGVSPVPMMLRKLLSRNLLIQNLLKNERLTAFIHDPWLL